jgi:hypothetical protein
MRALGCENMTSVTFMNTIFTRESSSKNHHDDLKLSVHLTQFIHASAQCYEVIYHDFATCSVNTSN